MQKYFQILFKNPVLSLHQKSDRDTTKRRKFRRISPMNLDAK